MQTRENQKDKKQTMGTLQKYTAATPKTQKEKE